MQLSRFAPHGPLPLHAALLGCALSGLSAATLGCSAASPPHVVAAKGPVEARPAHPAEPAVDPEPLGPARTFPPTERGDIGMEAWEPDGSRRVIAQGVRLVEHPGGAVDAADQLLPTSRTLPPTRLPARLGGGWVFGVNAGSEGLLWRAATWTSPLTPLARLDGEIERLVPGFDRLYVLRARGTP